MSVINLVDSFRKGVLPLLALIVLMVSTACATGKSLTVADDGLDMPVDALLVAPFEVRYPAEPWASYVRTVEEVDAAVALNSYPVYSYGDYAAFSTDKQALYAGRSVLSLVGEAGLDYSRVALLRGQAKAISLGQHQSNGSRPADSDVEILLEVELLHLGTLKPIAQGQRRLVVSPLDRKGDGDPYPKLTKAHRELAEEVLLAAEERVPGDKTSELPFTLMETHKRVFDIAVDGVPSLAEAIEKQDALTQDTETLKTYGWFYPDISGMDASTLKYGSEGLYVKTSNIPEVLAGEWLISAGGVSLEGIHQLHRLWYTTFPGSTLWLTVLGADGQREVALEKPEN